METLTFNFWGAEQHVEYTFTTKAAPIGIIEFTVYPINEEIRVMIGASKTFVFHKNNGVEITWNCSEKSRILHKLCKAIAESLLTRITDEMV